MSPSRGVENPVPTGIHTLAWTAADECCEKPRTKKLVAFGVDKPNSSEPVKGLKEGVFRCEVRSVFAGKKRMGQEGRGKGLVLFEYFLLVFLCPYGLSKVVSGVRWWCVQLSLGASRIVGLEIWVDWFLGCWLQLL